MRNLCNLRLLAWGEETNIVNESRKMTQKLRTVRGPEFGPQHSRGGSQSSVTPFSRDATHSPGLYKHQALA